MDADRSEGVYCGGSIGGGGAQRQTTSPTKKARKNPGPSKKMRHFFRVFLLKQILIAILIASL